MTEYRYYMDGDRSRSEEVNQIVLDIERLCFQVAIEPMKPYSTSKVDHQELAKFKAKRGLLEGIEKYIKTEVRDDYMGEKTVIATVYLPYIYDDVLVRQNNELKSLGRQIGIKDIAIRVAQNRIDYLHLPWYKKLWLKVKKAPKK